MNQNQDFLASDTPMQSSLNAGSNRYNYTIDELKKLPDWQNLSEDEIQDYFSKMGKQATGVVDTSAQAMAGLSPENLNLDPNPNAQRMTTNSSDSAFSDSRADQNNNPSQTYEREGV